MQERNEPIGWPSPGKSQWRNPDKLLSVPNGIGNILFLMKRRHLGLLLVSGLCTGRVQAQAVRREVPPLEVPFLEPAQRNLLQSLVAGLGASGAPAAEAQTGFTPDVAAMRATITRFVSTAAPRWEPARRDRYLGQMAPEDMYRDVQVGGTITYTSVPGQDQMQERRSGGVMVRGTDLADGVMQFFVNLLLSANVAEARALSAHPDPAALFGAGRARIAQAYAATPSLMALDAAQRRDLAGWLRMNREAMFLMEIAARGEAPPSMEVSAAARRAGRSVQGRAQTMARGLGLTTDRIRMLTAA